MKKYQRILMGLSVVVVVFAAAFVFVGKAQAIAPSFSVTALRQGGIQIIVQGDANSQVQLYSGGYTYGYGGYNNGAAQNLGTIGTTDMYGYFSTTIYNSGMYNLVPGSMIYVVVNGQTSQILPYPIATIPYNNFYNNSNYYPYAQYYYAQPVSIPITFSLENPSINVGQSMTITINGSGNYYISSNSNPGTVNASIISNNLYVNGTSLGSSSINICDYFNSCRSIGVTVSGYQTPAPMVYYPNTYYSNTYYPNYNYNNQPAYYYNNVSYYNQPKPFYPYTSYGY
jgi:hypothetical protein